MNLLNYNRVKLIDIKRFLIIVIVFTCGNSTITSTGTESVDVVTEHVIVGSQWDGKIVGVLGDSMSDPQVKATTVRYHDYLKSLLGIDTRIYAKNGYKFAELLPLSEKMYETVGDSLDAIFIWCGTNDYNASKPIGEFFTEEFLDVDVNGDTVLRKHRVPVMSDSTFCGSINMVLSYLKDKFPKQQIVIFTPIHRGYAHFGSTNVQPDENYANGVGLYIEDYVNTLRKAGDIWSIPVIDLFSLSGIYPISESNDKYVAKKKTDRLHPNEEGHYRIARTAQYQLLTIPSSFKQ